MAGSDQIKRQKANGKWRKPETGKLKIERRKSTISDFPVSAFRLLLSCPVRFGRGRK
jgi:hypothetical protein